MVDFVSLLIVKMLLLYLFPSSGELSLVEVIN